MQPSRQRRSTSRRSSRKASGGEGSAPRGIGNWRRFSSSAPRAAAGRHGSRNYRFRHPDAPAAEGGGFTYANPVCKLVISATGLLSSSMTLCMAAKYVLALNHFIQQYRPVSIGDTEAPSCSTSSAPCPLQRTLTCHATTIVPTNGIYHSASGDEACRQSRRPTQHAELATCRPRRPTIWPTPRCRWMRVLDAGASS